MLEKWQDLIFGSYDIQTVLVAVKDANWQRTRRSMLGTTTEFKYNTLVKYLEDQNYSGDAQCRVTNYVYALKRGGILK